MLDFIRSNAQSVGVKLIFGLIIVVFIFWGVGSLTDTSSGSVVAVVNGDGISIGRYQKAYQQAVESLQRQNPGMSREDLARQNVGQMVLQALIMQTLLAQEATRLGISVSPQEMRQAVEAVDAFRNSKGEFDPALFKSAVERAYGSVTAFEDMLREELLRNKLEALVAAGVWSNMDESLAFYQYLRQKRAVSYAFIPASRFAAEIKVSDEDIAKRYESDKKDYEIPAKAAVEYVAVSPALLVKPESISAAEVEAEYARDTSRFMTPEQIKAAHILVPLPENASPEDVKQAEESMAAIRKELADGKPFAEVADAHNGPNAANKGGELGWIRRGETVPAFEEAAFALEPGKLSDNVRSPFGLHLILVSEKKAAAQRPLAEVEGEIRAELSRLQGREKINDALDGLVEDNILKKSLADSAARFGLSAEKTEALSAADLGKALSLSPENIALIMAAGSGNPVDTALEAGERYLIVRVLATEPAHIPPLADVRADIEKKIVAERALEAARKAAEAERATLEKTDADLKQAVMGRDGLLADFAPNTSLTAAVFESPADGSWLKGVYSVSGEKEGSGALLCRVDSIQEADPAEWEAIRENFDAQLRNRRSEELAQLFRNALQRKAEIRQNPELIRQIGG
ncbi:SurA N-terminal domain-containing protein [uncultured Desulfovibrio sp.]|uniref:Periplasmic chaperone PpiD n=1 Tax=Candidatus Desulfovibrio intestinavium TaxID=2838534 RepID=A0A9D2KPZ1_9BACT|nr:SurA N-terminal domain-containing protein [uncultured Desulfovibrio sp.]HJA78433.1 SurA N-terminal domain-containing protein [Candidatus Desulfovibrio intestinavium]